MRVRVRFSLPIAAMGLLASGVAPADEASLTGIWEGIQVCDDSQAGVQVNFVTDDRVEITKGTATSCSGA